MSDKKGVKALAFDHYGTLFNKHAVAEVIEQDFPGRGEEVAQLWFKTIKKYCWLSGMMERYLTWDDLTKRALVFSGKSLGLEIELVGSRGMPVTRYDSMLRMVAADKLQPGRLVTRTVPLEEAGAVLASMDDYDTLGFTVIEGY